MLSYCADRVYSSKEKTRSTSQKNVIFHRYGSSCGPKPSKLDVTCYCACTVMVFTFSGAVIAMFFGMDYTVDFVPLFCGRFAAKAFVCVFLCQSFASTTFALLRSVLSRSINRLRFSRSTRRLITRPQSNARALLTFTVRTQN